MAHEFSLDENIDLMVVSLHRNLFTSLLFGIGSFLLQGLVIVLFAFLFERVLVTIVLIGLGSVIVLIGLFTLIGNMKQALVVRDRMEAMKTELPAQPDESEEPARE